MLIIAAAVFSSALALDNGLALTPPLGWRSWNCDQGRISDALIRSQVGGLLTKRDGVSLLDLGFAHAGIDDGWQACNSYTVEPSGSPAFHNANGSVNVNLTRFPDLKQLVTDMAAVNIKLGWYIDQYSHKKY